MVTLSPRSNIINARFTYTSKASNLKNGLKYLQYRDQADKHLPQIDPDGNQIQRWVDMGLGDNHSEILQSLQDRKTKSYSFDKNVLARTLVVSPAVNFMQAIPDEKKLDLLQELTQQTVSRWFEKMDIPPAEYSYVTHIAESKDTRPDGQAKDAPGQQPFLHSHVVLSPTYDDLGDRRAYKVYEKQLDQLTLAGREAMQDIWTRELGQEKVQELNHELEVQANQYREKDAERSLLQAQGLHLNTENLEFSSYEKYKNQTLDLHKSIQQELKQDQEISSHSFPENAMDHKVHDIEELIKDHSTVIKSNHISSQEIEEQLKAVNSHALSHEDIEDLLAEIEPEKIKQASDIDKLLADIEESTSSRQPKLDEIDKMLEENDLQQRSIDDDNNLEYPDF